MAKAPEAAQPKDESPESSWLGVIESRLGYVLHRTDLLHMEILRGILRQIGLTPARATAIAFIHNNPGVDQSTLARALGINRASSMELVNVLDGLGAVQRRPGPNRRSHSLHLTAKGKKLYASFIEASAESDRLLSADLTEKEQRQLDSLLRRIRASLGRHLSTQNENEDIRES